MGQSCFGSAVTEKLHLLLSLCLRMGLGPDQSARLQSLGQLSYLELWLCQGTAKAGNQCSLQLLSAAELVLNGEKPLSK